jgi:signal peptide peptidase SppA
MKTELLIAEFLSTPWALMPERLNAVSAVMARWSSHAPATTEVLAGIDTDKLAREARRQTATSVSGGGIAVLPLYGVITQRGNMIEDVSGPGSVSTQRFASALRQALADESVSQILIDIDSPGGSVYGVAELADEIVAARAQKPIIAIANSLAASAAYWIGCSASEFYVTPGGEVGSIGVWQAHFDYSQALAAEGVTPTLISAGTYKVEGNPYAPLSPEAQAFMQSRVDDYYLAFCKGVARGRGVPVAQVRNGMGQGRVLGADAAIEQGMINGVITLNEMLNKLQRNSRFKMPAQSRLTNACRSLSVAIL